MNNEIVEIEEAIAELQDFEKKIDGAKNPTIKQWIPHLIKHLSIQKEILSGKPVKVTIIACDGKYDDTGFLHIIGITAQDEAGYRYYWDDVMSEDEFKHKQGTQVDLPLKALNNMVYQGSI